MPRFSLLSLALLLVPLFPLPLAAQPEPAQPLLQVEGALEESDLVLSEDGTYYDEYRFEGQAGQTIVILLESAKFDAYLLLRDPQGNTIAKNDDRAGANNARITVTLPVAGSYAVLANSSGSEKTGEYRLNIKVATAQDIALMEPDRLAEQGNQQKQDKQYTAALESFQKALELYRAAGDRLMEATVLYQIGLVYKEQEQYPQALESLQHALKAVQAINDRSAQADVLVQIGVMRLELTEYAEALEQYQQALTLYQADNNRKEEGETLNRIGVVYDRQKDYPAALDYYQQALAIHREVKNAAGELQTLNNIADVYSKQEKYTEATEYYQQVLAIYREKGDRYNEAETLYKLGGVYKDLKQYPKALENYQQALEIYKSLNKVSDEAHTLYWIGNVYQNQEQYSQALAAYGKALTLHRQTKNSRSELDTLNAIAYTYSFQANTAEEQRDYSQSYQIAEQALIFFQEQLSIAHNISNRTQKRDALTGIGFAYGQQANSFYQQGNYNQSLELDLKSLQFHEQALAISRELKDEIIQSLLSVFSSQHSISLTYNKLNNYESALEYVHKAQTIATEAQDPEREYIALWQELLIYGSLNLAYSQPTQYAKRLEISQKIITLARRLNQPGRELDALLDIAQVHRFQGRYTQASEIFEQVLARARATSKPYYEIIALQGMGMVSLAQADYPKAIERLEQAWQISQIYSYRIIESVSINHLADIYQRQGNYSKSFEYLEKSLKIDQEIYQKYTSELTLESLKNSCPEIEHTISGLEFIPDIETYRRLNVSGELLFDQCKNLQQMPSGNLLGIFISMRSSMAEVGRNGMGTVFDIFGSIYANQGNYPKALKSHQQALAVERELKNLAKESIVLNNTAKVYSKQGNYVEALKFTQQALEIAVAQGDHTGQIAFLLSLGDIQRAYGNYAEALEIYQKALTLTRQSSARSKEAAILLSISQAYGDQGNYAKALENANQALKIQQEIGEPANVALTLNALGVTHRKLGQFQQALNFQQQALDLTRKIGAGSQETGILLNIAASYREQGKPDLALQTYQQALSIAKSRGEIETESIVLTGIGKLYLNQSQPTDAMTNLQQALNMQRQIGVRSAEADTLQAIGQAHIQLNQPTEAQTALQRSLILANEIGDRATEAQALANLGQVSAQQAQPEVAIAFYKQSVNITEQIRQGLQTLSRDQQASYTETVSDRYRELADLLISQGRLSEAQQVLELLKLEELREFTRSAASGQSSGVLVLDAEQVILDLFGSFTNFAKQLYDCEQTQCANLGPLRDQLDARTIQFNQDINGFRKTLQERLAQDPGSLTSDDLDATARQIVTAEPGTVLIYPLVLKDKIRILLAIRAGEQGVLFRAFETEVKQETLWQKVNQFRQQLGDATPSGPVHSVEEVQETASQLYEWLIKPLEAEIQAEGVRHLVFSLDRSTRYIPMAALFDASQQQYLIQRYAVSTILSARLTNTTERLSANPAENPVLAMGLSMPVGSFSALDSVPSELDGIVKTNAADVEGVYPGDEFLNPDFTFANLRDNLSRHRILHIASHAEFEAPPENSFILSADGEIRIDRIQTLANYGLSNIHLVVLSACRTGVGGPDASGIEVPGISFYFLSKQVESVMASLWAVNDGSTSLLMQQFYRNLAQGMSKAKALQQAQLSLIERQPVGDSQSIRSDVNVTPDGSVAVTSRSGATSSGYAHPYYWAPFILIGNGL